LFLPINRKEVPEVSDQPPWPKAATRTCIAFGVVTILVIAAAVVAIAAIGGHRPSAPANTMSGINVAVIPAPVNVPAHLYELSSPLSDIKVGETRFTVIDKDPNWDNEPYWQGAMTPMSHRAQDNSLCITEKTRSWPHTALQVGEFGEVNAAITRTGTYSYVFITHPSLMPVAERLANSGSPRPCLQGSVTLATDEASRKPLNFLSDMKPGEYGWVAHSSILTGDEDPTRGYLQSQTASTTEFEESYRVTAELNGALSVPSPLPGELPFMQIKQGDFDELAEDDMLMRLLTPVTITD
jgi:hypothetical protein